MRKHLRGFAEAGVDQVAFIQQGGRNKHEHICEALELFARDVMPEFKEHAEARQKRKMEELAPFVEQAFARKQKMRELTDDEIPNVIALGRQVAQQTPATPAEQQARRVWSEQAAVPLEDPAKKAKKGAAE